LERLGARFLAGVLAIDSILEPYGASGACYATAAGLACAWRSPPSLASIFA